MKIKIVPESEEEKSRYGDNGVEYSNVKEFFIFGNNIDEDKDFSDFHEWHGSYRYLMGSLMYFYETLRSKQSESMSTGDVNLKFVKKGGIKSAIEPIDVSQLDGQNVEEGNDNIETELRILENDENNSWLNWKIYYIIFMNKNISTIAGAGAIGGAGFNIGL